MTDRVWRTTSQVELAIVEWIGWYNGARLHSSLDDIPPAEFETTLAVTTDLITPATPALTN